MRFMPLIVLMLMYFPSHAAGGRVYTVAPIPEAFSYTRCEEMLNHQEAASLSQQFDPSRRLGKCHVNADVTSETLSLFNLEPNSEAWAEFSQIGEDKFIKLKDSGGKIIWQVGIPKSPAYRSKPNVPPEMEPNYSNHFYDFTVLKGNPHIRLYLSGMNEGRGGLYVVGLDVTCDHRARFLVDQPVTAREYSVWEKNGQRMCRIPVMHFYELLPNQL